MKVKEGGVVADYWGRRGKAMSLLVVSALGWSASLGRPVAGERMDEHS